MFHQAILTILTTAAALYLAGYCFGLVFWAVLRRGDKGRRGDNQNADQEKR